MKPRRALMAVILLLSACRLFKPLPDIAAFLEKADLGDEASRRLLIRYFASPVEGEDIRAFNALVNLKEKAVPELILALDDPDLKVAEFAAGALGNIKDRRAVSPLAAALRRREFPLYVGIWALGEIGGPEALKTLLPYLGHEQREIRKYAARALTKFGPGAVEAILPVVSQGDHRAGRYALRVLGQSGEKRAAAPILSHYRNLDPEVALWALGRLGAVEGLDLMARESAGPDWRVRLAAVQALAGLLDERTLPALRRALDDEEWIIREWAARGIEDTTGLRQLYRDEKGRLVVPYNLYR